MYEIRMVQVIESVKSLKKSSSPWRKAAQSLQEMAFSAQKTTGSHIFFLKTQLAKFGIIAYTLTINRQNNFQKLLYVRTKYVFPAITLIVTLPATQGKGGEDNITVGL